MSVHRMKRKVQTNNSDGDEDNMIPVVIYGEPCEVIRRLTLRGC